MGRIYAIALNAYREAIRDRVLFGVLGLAAASLLLGLSLAVVSVAEQARILVDHGLVTLSWVSNLVAIFLGASFLYKEIELRTLYVILAKPVARWEFVLGKYVGIVATVVVFIALTASALLVLLALQAAELKGASSLLQASRSARLGVLGMAAVGTLGVGRVALKIPAVARMRAALGGALSVLGALALLGLCTALARPLAPLETSYTLLGALLVAGEVLVTAAVATLFSSFSTPFVTGMLTFGVFLIGRSAGAMLELRSRMIPLPVRELLRGIATVVPNLQLFVPTRQSLIPRDEVLPVGRFLASALGYGGLYAAMLLAMAAWLFRRRDLT